MINKADDIGSIGESEFSVICRKAGYTTTSTDQDKNGWDFLIECPQKSILRSASTSPKCFVQVKATLHGETRWEISLKNALNLASWTGPSFIALLDFEQDLNLKRILFVHFDKKELKRIYQRLNKEYEKDPFVEIHKKTISFDFKSEKIIKGNLSHALKEYFEEIFISDFNHYTSRKINLIEDLFEKHLKSFQYVEIFGESEIQLFTKKSDTELSPFVKISGLNDLRHFLDFFLGYKNQLPESTVKSLQNLTGKDIIETKLNVKTYFVSYGQNEVVGQFQSYSTSNIPNLPLELHTTRLTSTFLDFLIRKKSTEFTLRVNLPHEEEIFDITELSKSICLYHALKNTKDEFSLFVQETLESPRFAFKLKKINKKETLLPDELTRKILNTKIAFDVLEVNESTSFYFINQCYLSILLLNIYKGNRTNIHDVYYEVKIKDQYQLDRSKPIFVFQTGVVVINFETYFQCSFVFKDCLPQDRLDGEYVISNQVAIAECRYEKMKGRFDKSEFDLWTEREALHYEKLYTGANLVIAEN